MSKRSIAVALAAAVLLTAGAPVRAAEGNPFTPPTEREKAETARVRRLVGEAVAASEAALRAQFENRMNEVLAAKVREAVEAKAGGPDLDKRIDEGVDRSLKRKLNETPFQIPTPPGLGQPQQPATETARKPAFATDGMKFVGCMNGKAYYRGKDGQPVFLDPARVADPAAAGCSDR